MSGVELTRERQPGYDIVTLVGDLDLETVETLPEPGLGAVDDEDAQPVLVIDLNGVGFLDSSGIGAVVAARRRAAARQAEMVLAVSSPHLLKLLRISGLDTLVRVVGSVDELFRDDDGGAA